VAAPGDTSRVVRSAIEERAMTIDFIELNDLGDATRETKQLMPSGPYLDSMYYLGWLPDWG
jgi:hypothetical protein